MLKEIALDFAAQMEMAYGHKSPLLCIIKYYNEYQRSFSLLYE